MAMMPDPTVEGRLYTGRMDAGVSPEGEVPTNSGRKRITWLVCALRLISSRRSMLVSGMRTEPCWGGGPWAISKVVPMPAAKTQSKTKIRSEERRVGKESRARWAQGVKKKK